MRVTRLSLAGESFLLRSDAAGILSFVWFIYTLLCSVSKGISPRLPFSGPYAEWRAVASQKQAAEQK